MKESYNFASHIYYYLDFCNNPKTNGSLLVSYCFFVEGIYKFKWNISVILANVCAQNYKNSLFLYYFFI